MLKISAYVPFHPKMNARSCAQQESASSYAQNPEETRGRGTRRAVGDAPEERTSKVAKGVSQGTETDEPNPKRFRGPPAGSSQSDYTDWMRANRHPTSQSQDAAPSRAESEQGNKEEAHEDLCIRVSIPQGRRHYGSVFPPTRGKSMPEVYA